VTDGPERIAAAFASHGRRAALMPYLMGGFPDVETSLRVGIACADADADLVELGIPYRWEEGVVLVVPTSAEAQVDALLDEIDENAADGEGEGEAALLEVEAGEDGGEEAAAAMGDLFVAADGMSHGTYEEAEVVDFIEAAAAVAQCLPPFGIEAQVWGRIQKESSAIVTALEKGNEGDDDEGVIEAARSLRDLLRHYV